MKLVSIYPQQNINHIRISWGGKSACKGLTHLNLSNYFRLKWLKELQKSWFTSSILSIQQNKKRVFNGSEEIDKD